MNMKMNMDMDKVMNTDKNRDLNPDMDKDMVTDNFEIGFWSQFCHLLHITIQRPQLNTVSAALYRPADLC